MKISILLSVLFLFSGQPPKPVEMQLRETSWYSLDIPVNWKSHNTEGRTPGVASGARLWRDWITSPDEVTNGRRTGTIGLSIDVNAYTDERFEQRKTMYSTSNDTRSVKSNRQYTNSRNLNGFHIVYENLLEVQGKGPTRFYGDTWVLKGKKYYIEVMFSSTDKALWEEHRATASRMVASLKEK